MHDLLVIRMNASFSPFLCTTSNSMLDESRQLGSPAEYDGECLSLAQW